MKYLSIDNGKGYYIDKEGAKKEIDMITKDDILRYLDLATDQNEDFEMDSFDPSALQNEAHKIIYKSLHSKFSTIVCNKSQFLDVCDNLYKDALQKYTISENS